MRSVKQIVIRIRLRSARDGATDQAASMSHCFDGSTSAHLQVQPPLPLALRLPSDARVRKVVQAILSEPRNSRALEAWCDIANASIAGYSSVPAFGAAFREVFGMTPAQAKAHRTAA